MRETTVNYSNYCLLEILLHGGELAGEGAYELPAVSASANISAPDN